MSAILLHGIAAGAPVVGLSNDLYSRGNGEEWRRK